MRSLETSPRPLVFLWSLLILPLAGGPPAAVASTADVSLVRVAPAEPTTCDSVTIEAGGVLSSSCLEIVSAEITGPTPPNPLCMGPVCPSRFEIRITVQEPRVPTPCPTVLVPYRRSFSVGALPEGAYAVRAVEVLQHSDAVSAGSESTEVSTLFFVRRSSTCPPDTSCYLLGFAPWQYDPGTIGFCTTTVGPGGTALFDVTLYNRAPVAGVQTEVAIYDPRLDPPPNGPIPPGLFTPKSVEAVGRAQGFQVDWTTEGGAIKLILYSATGASIPPGNGGAILRIGYGVGADTPAGSYVIAHLNEVISDPDGDALPPCPTFRETSGRLCVTTTGCDVNDDGTSDIRDIIRIVRCALAGAGTEACPDTIASRADCNGDGGIDVRDVICCVRKILAMRLGSIRQPPGVPSPGPGTAISFLGDVDWTTPVDGHVRIRLAPGSGVAGAEWMMLLGPGDIRVRDLRVVSGGSVHLEWSSDDAGRAFAMLYTEDGAPIEQDVLLDLGLERALGAGEMGFIDIVNAQAAAWDGAPVSVRSAKPFAVAGATSVSAPAVYPARPNPFVGESEITFALPAVARAELRIYDVRGRLTRTLVNETRAPGVYRERWDGRSDDGRTVASGVYLLRFRAGGVEQTQRLLRLR